MILDNEEQRKVLLDALMNVPIQADYPGLCEIFPRFQSAVIAVQTASIAESTIKKDQKDE